MQRLRHPSRNTRAQTIQPSRKSGTNGSESGQEDLGAKRRSLEAQVKRNKGRPLLMGRDLEIIRDNDQYEGTWDKYCRRRFRFSGRNGNYYISAWRTAQICGVPEDFPPRALRPLTRLTPEKQRDAWAVAVALTRAGIPSAMQIEIAVHKFTRRPISEWSISIARQIVSRGFIKTVQKAYNGANSEQMMQLDSELPELVSHVRELTRPPQPAVESELKAPHHVSTD
jgi:hypothetical protein